MIAQQIDFKTLLEMQNNRNQTIEVGLIAEFQALLEKAVNATQSQQLQTETKPQEIMTTDQWLKLHKIFYK